VVLRRDLDLAGREVDHRLVAAVVAELHLVGLAAEHVAEDLVAEADAEHRHLLHEHRRRADRVAADRGVAGAVAEEHAVGLALEHRGRGGGGRHHGDVEAARDERTQDVALRAEVVGDDAGSLAAPWAVPGGGGLQCEDS
jgi:hypothetical protein